MKKTMNYTKTMLAKEMGISMTTMHYYLNVKWYDELVASGYFKHSKILQPRIVDIIKRKWWG